MKNGSNYEYQYSITDHQGNTRVVFTSAAQTTQSVSAGFETANQTTEASNFSNYPSGSHISTLAMNAHSGSNSLYLNGGYSGQVGVAKSYKVYPGDQLNIQAYAKYNAPTGTPSNLTGFATALLNAFNLAVPAQGEVGTASSGINTFGGIEAGGWGDGSTDNADPKVFVSIVLFDKNYKFLDVTFAQLTTSGVLMSASYKVKEAGYAYLYVSNENSTIVDVYFDDVTMSYTPTNIIQSNEYYAHSMPTANSWTRDNTTNNFLGNGGTELNTTTSNYDLMYRNFDPALGRFHQVDPMVDQFASHSPYNFAFNNPILLNDPKGDYPPSVTFEYTVYGDARNGGFRQGTLERWAANEEQRDRDRMNRNTTVEELDAAYITFQDGSSMVWLKQSNVDLATVYDYVTPGGNKSAMAQLDPSQWNPLTDPEVMTQGGNLRKDFEDMVSAKNYNGAVNLVINAYSLDARVKGHYSFDFASVVVGNTFIFTTEGLLGKDQTIHMPSEALVYLSFPSFVHMLAHEFDHVDQKVNLMIGTNVAADPEREFLAYYHGYNSPPSLPAVNAYMINRDVSLALSYYKLMTTQQQQFYYNQMISLKPVKIN